jgi:hypothetical protein
MEAGGGVVAAPGFSFCLGNKNIMQSNKNKT